MIHIRIDHHVHMAPDADGAFARLTLLIKQGFKGMADKLDTVLARVAAQTSVIDGIAAIVDTWVDDRVALRAQIVELQAALGEAGNDTEQVDALLASFDASDTKLNAIKDKLAPAVVTNTPAETPAPEVPPAA